MILIIYLFLGTLRSALIPVIAIPISLIGAAFLMLLFGFTINLLTLLAVVLSVGLVVDDAIVVVENVERHLQEGLTPFQAAINGARELLGPLIAMTISLAAVYAPIGIQGGLTGALFREFAFTLAGAVTVSGVVAITLSPMMCSKLLRAGESERGYAAWINHRFDGLRDRYMRKLGESLQWRPVTLVLGLLVVSAIFWFYKSSAKELAPKEDQGIIFGIVQASPNSTIDQTGLFTSKAKEVFASLPEAAHVFQLTMPTSGFAGMVTKPWSQRKRTTQQMEKEVSAKTAGVPGIRLLAVTPEPLPGGSAFPVEIVVASTAEANQLLEFANKLVAKAVESGLFFFADTDLKYDLPQAEVVFDREKVASLGLNLQQVGADLGTMLGGNYVNRFSIQGRSYKVIPQIKRTERLTTDQLKEVYVSGPGGKLVQLSTFAGIKQTTEPRTLNRFQQLNSARIQGVIKPGVPLDQALKLLENEGEKILPKGFAIDYAGSARQLRLEGDKLTFTMLLSFILIFLVLAAQFNSFRDPFIILLGSVPLALSGALLFTFLGFTSLNIYSQIGLITLVGLIAKNGILIVEFANTLQEQGRSRLEAVIEAAGTRLRPILMTTTATIVGHLPLVFAKGPGAACRNSIGIVLITGMIIGTTFTLFVVPAIYTFLAKDRKGQPLDAGEETSAEEAMELVEA